MIELRDFKSEGFFDRPTEEQKHYTELIYTVCKDILNDLEREYPNGDARLSYLMSLTELKKSLIREEDYEMTYLINNTIERLQEWEK